MYRTSHFVDVMGGIMLAAVLFEKKIPNTRLLCERTYNEYHSQIPKIRHSAPR